MIVFSPPIGLEIPLSVSEQRQKQYPINSLFKNNKVLRTMACLSHESLNYVKGGEHKQYCN